MAVNRVLDAYGMPFGNVGDDTDPEKLPTAIVPAIELPVYGVKPADRKWINDRILAELDNGQFLNAGIQGDAILRNARITGAYEQRMAGIFAAPLEMLPPDDSTDVKQVSDDVKARWPKMFPRAACEE